MPYTELELFETPDDDQEIWRYMTFAKLVWVLEASQLHFHKVAEFEDPFEGSIPNSYYEIRESAMEEELADSELDIDEYMRSMEASAEMMHHLICGNCWHNNSRESAAMWDQYDGRSIAIVSTIGDLKSALEQSERRIYLHSVDYVDFGVGADEITSRDRRILNRIVDRAEGPTDYIPYMLKRLEYRHENEVRALLRYGDDWTDEGWDTGTNVGISVNDLINRVQVSPYAPDWLSSAVEFAVENASQDMDRSIVNESNLNQDPTYMLR